MLECRTLKILLLVAGTWGSAAFAASDSPIDTSTIDKNRQANEACFACHSTAGIAKPPRAGLDLNKLRDSHVEPTVFNPSDHGVMDCRECHSKTHYNDYPHAEVGKSETVGCTECHAAKVLRLEPQFNASVHAQVKGVKEKFTCFTCHNPHINIVQKRLKDPAKIVAQDNQSCLECHNSDLNFARFAPEGKKTPGVKKLRPDIDTIHDWLPNARGHWQAVRCIECHTPEVAEAKMLSHEILDKEKAEKKCLACHSANSTLKVRLYRHMAKDEQQKYGFTNSIFLSNSYIIGATRHPLLDAIIIIAVLLTLAGVLTHGAIRIVLALRRKGKTK